MLLILILDLPMLFFLGRTLQVPQQLTINNLARTNTGATISVGFNEIKEIQADFEYQGAGEIWFHTSSDTIEKWVREAIKHRKFQ